MTVMTYKSAVQLLARDDSKILSILDRVLGLGLLAAAVVNPLAALAYFDAKNEFISQLNRLLVGLKDRVRRSTRLEYEQLISASHAVIVMVSFSEELAGRLHQIDEDGRWRAALKAWKNANSSEERVASARTQLVTWGNRTAIEPPGPSRPFEAVAGDLQRTYGTLSGHALEYLQGLSQWDELDESQQWRIERELREKALVNRAINRYREHYVRLAADVPEFLVWTLLNESAASRHHVNNVVNSVLGKTRFYDDRLPDLVEQLTTKANALENILQANVAALGDLPSTIAALIPRENAAHKDLLNRIAECHKVHQLVLDKPLLTPRLDVALEKLRFPANRAGYINPNFRLYETRHSDEGSQLAQENWWEEHAVKSGLGGHLAAYFRSRDATRRPLLVLGDPGSGKSLLSKVLAAQLPPDEFAVARVELRHVRSSQEVSDQIDLELQRQTNKRFSLSDLTDPNGQIVRVAIMDGLDELLQLSSHEGLGRYLEKLAEFQEVEATYDRPVIAIATARTIVMDRIFVPRQTTVIKLEGFTEEQIGSWITVWNATNDEYFSDRGLEPLSAPTLNRYSELTRQPLLLALLALYDAEDNALQNAGELSQAELYERLFKRYLEREIEKESLPARQDYREQLVEQRFRELSTIAMGMLNRGRRFITRHELEEDYKAVTLSRNSDPGNEHAVSADDAVGQFFFLYRAMAQHRGSTLNEGYEFIHATFGEFLGARMISHQLAQAATVTQQAPIWDRPEAERHARSLLIPYLARRPLAGEEQVLLFLGKIMGGLVDGREDAALAIAGLIPSVVRMGADDAISTSPTGQDRFERLAVLSINLVVASLHTAAKPIPLCAFCLPDQHAIDEWRRLSVLWKTYLPIDDWDVILRSLYLTGMPEEPAVRLGAPRSVDAGTETVLVPPTMTFGLGRTILEARLVGDAELAAAAIAWCQVRIALKPFDAPDVGGEAVQDNVAAAWRLAAAAARIGSTAGRETAADAALHALSSPPSQQERILEIIEGGIGTWEESFLKAVVALIADQPNLETSASSLLRLTCEADHRGYAAEARRLLKRLPGTKLGDLSAADVASIVRLSRRHQLRGLIGQCVDVTAVSRDLFDRLSVDDVVWLMEDSGLPHKSLARIRQDLLATPQYARMIQTAEAMLSNSDRARS